MTDVRPGQVWADNDQRSAGRTVRVERIEGDKAICTVLTNITSTQAHLDGNVAAAWGVRDTRGKTTRISLARFRPTQSGYRLVEG
jgi:hypothetical protein